MSKQKVKIPDAERDVLVCLNRLERATVKEIQESLTPVRELDVSSDRGIEEGLPASDEGFVSACVRWGHDGFYGFIL